MTVIRTERDCPYTIIPNHIFEAEMSLEAKGMLAFFLTMRDDWRFRQKDICERMGIGKDKYQRIIRELKDLGFAETHTLIADDGTLAGSEMIIRDNPRQPDFPAIGKHRSGETPTIGKDGPITNTNLSTNTKGSNKKGTRIAKDWQADEEDLHYARSKGMTPSRISLEAEKFYNFWVAKTGANATKLDWHATWRSWILNCLRREDRGSPRRASRTDDALEALARAAGRE